MTGTGRWVVGAVVLGLAYGLAGCDAVEGVRDRLSPEEPQLRKFGMATRVRQENGRAGEFEVVIESTEEASWVDAMAAMLLQRKLECDDGGSLSLVDQSPKDPPWQPPQDAPPLHPAGTLFKVHIRCTSTYPRTLPYPFELSREDALERAKAALGPAPQPEGSILVTRQGGYNTSFRKFPAVTQALGGIVLDHQTRCAGQGGVVIYDSVLLEQEVDPDPPLGPDIGQRLFALAAYVACATPAPAP